MFADGRIVSILKLLHGGKPVIYLSEIYIVFPEHGLIVINNFLSI